ncbi:MAG: serine acetyltransferase [Spirochaetales bacterium]|nr:serine acetyltransferase [Spirochaetales bacterium]MCF7938581.1 serine acetyltransferase [Spirochaetales bacterium]
MEQDLNSIRREILKSYDEYGGINHIDGPNLPSRESIIAILGRLEALIFPGYQSDEPLRRQNLSNWLSETLRHTAVDLTTEIERCLAYEGSRRNKQVDREQLWEDAEVLSKEILGAIPHIRELACMDVEAAFQGDPAARSREEVILSYPGLEAVISYRLSHEFSLRSIPFIPRMMSEYIHRRTGIDIHPAATIGDGFFVDHGTGVVIGETTVIGNNVKLYQGVTIGALSVQKEQAGTKRHPTIEDDVTIYSGATILGGKTVIGAGSVIGGNVWLTSSVPPGSRIYHRPSDSRTQR